MPSARSVAVSMAAGVLLVAGGCGDPVGRTIGEPVSLEDGDFLLPTFVPDDLHISSTSLSYDKPPSGDHRVTVYGDPGADDPVAGPMLAGVYEYSVADEDYLPPYETGSLFQALDTSTCPGDDDNYEKAKLDGLSARRGTVDGRHWVCWDDRRSLDDGDYCSECVDQLALVGRGVPAEAVWRAAKEARVDEHDAIQLPDDVLPEDMEYVDSRRLDAISDSLTWTDIRADAELRLNISSAAAQAVAGRAMLGGEPVTIRGGPGVIQSDGARTRVLWQEGHLLLAVSAHGVARSDVQAFVEGLERAPENRYGEQVGQLEQRIVRYPAERMVTPRERVAITARIEGMRFALGVRGDVERGFQARGHVLVPDSGYEYGPTIEPRPLDGSEPVTFRSGSWLSDRKLWVGLAEPDVAKVELVYEGYITKRLPLGAPMPDGSKFFAGWLAAEERPRRLVAYDADGAELANGPISKF